MLCMPFASSFCTANAFSQSALPNKQWECPVLKFGPQLLIFWVHFTFCVSVPYNKGASNATSLRVLP